MTSTSCDPCTCPDMYYRNTQSWQYAALKLLCDIFHVISGATPPTTQAYFEPIVTVAYSSIGATYAVEEDFPDGTRSFNIVNHTDGDVYVSMNGGANDHYLLAAAESLSVNLFELGLITTTQVALKQGPYAPTEGSVLIYSIR